MANDRIDDLIDLAAIKGQVADALKEIARLEEAKDRLNKADINLKGATSSKDTVQAHNEAATAISKVTKAQDDLTKSTVQKLKIEQEAEKLAQQKLKTEQETEKLTQQRIKTDKLREEQAKRTTQALKEEAEVPFTHNLNADGTVIEPKQGMASGSIVSDVEKAQVEGILTAKEYAEAQKGVSESFVETQANAKKYAVTQKEIDLALAQDKLQAQKRTAELKNQVREETAVKGSIEQRRAALVRLNAVYDNLSPQERNSAAGQRLQKITLGITEQLKQLEAASGRAQRNVGNYPVSSFNGLKSQLKDATDQYNNLTRAEQKSAQGKELKGKIDTISKSLKEFGETSTISFGKAYSGIRILANILPGIGISGIFLLAGQAIAATVEYVKELAGRVVDFAEKMKALSQVNLKAIESFGEQRSHIEGLTAVIKDGNTALNDKNRALKDLIALDPKYLEGLTLANINTAEGKKILDDYIGLLKRKAELEAAQSVQGDAAKEVYKLEVIRDLLRKRLVATKTNYDDLTQEELKYVDKVKTSTGRINFTASLLNLEIPKSDIQQMLVGVDEELKKAGKKVTASMSVFKDKFNAVGDNDVKLGVVESLKKRIADLDKQIDFEPIKAKIPGLVAARKKLQEELDSLLDKTKNHGKHIKTIADAVAELRKELAAIKGKVDLGELAPKQADIDRVKAYDKAFEDIFKRGGKVNTPIVRTLKLELDPIQKRVLEEQIRDFANRVRDDRSDKPDFSDEEKKRRDLIVKNTSESVAEMVRLNNEGYTKQQEDLRNTYENKKALAKGNKRELLKIEEEYIKQAQANERQHARDQISLAINLSEALIDNLKARSDGSEESKKQIKGFEDQLSEQKAKLATFDIETAKKADEEKAKIEQKAKKRKEDLAKAEVELAEKTGALLISLFENNIETQKNQLAYVQRLKEENYARELASIQASSYSEQDKAAMTIQLQAKQAAERKKYDLQQKDLDIRKAKFDKEIALLKIAENTAVGITSALRSDPPNVPLAIVIGAIGAVEAATVLAKPIPRYAEGLENNPIGHIGMFGEAGPEVVDIPGKKPFIADKATIGFLPVGTNITPIKTDEVNAVLYRSMANQMGMFLQLKEANSNAKLDELIQAVKTTNRNIGVNVSGNKSFKEWNVWVNNITNWS